MQYIDPVKGSLIPECYSLGLKFQNKKVPNHSSKDSAQKNDLTPFSFRDFNQSKKPSEIRPPLLM